LEVAKEEIFDGKIETSKSLNKIISDLFNQFAENKKLLYEVELNQKVAAKIRFSTFNFN